MSESEREPEPGRSELGFSIATKNAVENWEKVHGKPKGGETVTLRITEMYVEFENPVRDYIVVLGTPT
jgi:hypothetical protein